ncbi:hypothetical protein K470DRAFT_73000 [Piedraia hortae CBS 480.64]|uniref:DNA repair protein rad9 n=1 Tax=Piedraia hortae CBS 480.64 TaxID=1314780 RepID=A0A6A7C0N2_9PEZI|nr:hypothetical protein K470DRAFT_73000 [Piedraia hortae CBS 480.64]
MVVLNFALTPLATGRVYDLLNCLAKFGETVAIEAQNDKLTLTTLNLSKTALASFTLDADGFFISYDFTANDSGRNFTCQLLNKALQSAFKGRVNEARNYESTTERCDVSIDEQPDQTECRFVVKMHGKHGSVRIHRLLYEATETIQAVFDRTAASQGWRISSKVLREYIEFFSPKTEQLEIVAQETKTVFTSYREKVQDGKEVLKQPLETAISIHTADFEELHMLENMRLIISVKDFKAIVTHAETLKVSVSAHFSYPNRPLQFSYQSRGLHCKFTLMTTGSSPANRTKKYISTRNVAPPATEPGRSQMEPIASRSHLISNKLKPSQSQRPSLRERVHQPIVADSDPDPESLFVPADDDSHWNPPNYDDDGEEMLGWATEAENPSTIGRPTIHDSIYQNAQHDYTDLDTTVEALQPTQRLSQLHAMFD